LYSNNDEVQTHGGKLGAAGAAGRLDPKAGNIEVGLPLEETGSIYGTGHSDLHTVPIWNQVEKNIQ